MNHNHTPTNWRRRLLRFVLCMTSVGSFGFAGNCGPPPRPENPLRQRIGVPRHPWVVADDVA
jgi:hypothetical protein